MQGLFEAHFHILAIIENLLKSVGPFSDAKRMPLKGTSTVTSKKDTIST